MEKRRKPPKSINRRTDVIQNGIAIRCFREKDGWTAAKLAAYLEISPAFLSYVENERRSAPRPLMSKIARALTVPEAAITRNPPSAATGEPVPAGVPHTQAVA